MPPSKSTLASRIRSARESANLTQADVADELGIPRSAVVQIEAGNRNVSSLELERIAHLVGRNIQDFLQPTFDEEEALTVLFRSTAPSSGGAVPPQVRDCITIARERRNLERLAGIERARRNPASYDLGRPGTRWESISQGDRIAEAERKRLGLDRAPIPDIAQLIESQGVQTALIELEDDISGFTLTGNSIPAIVAVNRSHHPHRQRFSFAHEYAHILLDQDAHGFVSRLSERDDLREMRANAFAGAFLLPEEGVREAVAELGKGQPSRQSTPVFDGSDSPETLVAESRTEPGSQDIQLYDVLQLAERFVVSPLAMIFRLKHLRFISEPELRLLRGEDEQRRIEDLRILLKLQDEGIGPSDAPLPPNPRFVGLALETYRRGKITRGKLLELLRLAGIPENDVDLVVATAGVDDDAPHGV